MAALILIPAKQLKLAFRDYLRTIQMVNRKEDAIEWKCFWQILECHYVVVRPSKKKKKGSD